MNKDEPRPVGQQQQQGDYTAVPQSLGEYESQQLGVYPPQNLKDAQPQPPQ